MGDLCAMALELDVPSTVEIDGKVIINKEVTFQGNSAYVTLWVRLKDKDTGTVVAGPMSFSAHGDKDHPMVYEEIKQRIGRDVDAWRAGIEASVEFRANTVTDLESDIISANYIKPG